jgi:N-formylglutamate amidohydrolase
MMQKAFKTFIFTLALCLAFARANNTNPQAALVYFGTDSLTEYIQGNMPLILTAPHGGLLKPDSIADRLCDGCVYANDAYTQSITKRIATTIFEVTGCAPHVIINHLHRSKMDGNRPLDVATAGNPQAEPAWHDFHGFIDSAKAHITQTYGKGLLLDIHGHAHEIARIEVGYRTTASQLRLSDSALSQSTIVASSTIKNIATEYSHSLSYAQLLRGPYSLGTLFANAGWAAVPSSADPFPLTGEPYFNGGYNVITHGSSGGGSIDAIQLEYPSTFRSTLALRQALADSSATVFVAFLKTHYKSDTNLALCFNNESEPEQPPETPMAPSDSTINNPPSTPYPPDSASEPQEYAPDSTSSIMERNVHIGIPTQPCNVRYFSINGALVYKSHDCELQADVPAGSIRVK